MKNTSQRNQIIGLGLAALLVAGRASATVTYLIGNGGLEPFDLAIDGTSYGGALAGGIALQKVSGDAGAPDNYVTLCTDIQGTVYLGASYTYDSPAPFGTHNGLAPRWGANNAGQSIATADPASASAAIQNAAVLFYTYYSYLTSGTTSQKAALQLAVWGSLYNTDAAGNITGSRFSFGGGDVGAVNLANIMLSTIALEKSGLGYTPTGDIFYPNPVSGQQYYGNPDPPQEFLFYVPPTTTFHGVPEPTTMIAGAMMLLPFGLSTARFFRKNRAV